MVLQDFGCWEKNIVPFNVIYANASRFFVVIIPRYGLFNKLGWVDTYLQFWIPGLLACYPFFIFMQVQFLRGIPKELDESACVDGCNPFMTYVKILFPLMKPAVFSVTIFQFLWRWNDYFNNLIYISSVKNYTLVLALKMSMQIKKRKRSSNAVECKC